MATLSERPLPEVVVGDGPVSQLAALIGRDADQPAPAAELAEAVAARGMDLAQLISDADFSARPGEVAAIALPAAAIPAAAERSLDGLAGARRLLLLGTGDGAAVDHRRAGAALARAARRVDEVGVRLADVPLECLRAFVTGVLVGAHSPRATGRTERSRALGRLRFFGVADRVAGDVTREVAAAVEAARATWLARDLAGMPSSVKNPAWLADAARQLAERDGVDVRVLGPADLVRHGFGGILAVGQGSATPPQLVVLDYASSSLQQAGRQQERHVVLVGKGITFDTGGLSLKPADAMVPMRTDMTGAAVVLATVLAAARRKVPHRVTAVLALAENAIGANSYRPDDVLTMWNGRTVEIANTDAEGRLVLADAMAWAAAEFSPDVMVDVATLTGAATLGLGRRHAAMYTADDSLAAALTDAGQSSGELVWRMPLVEDYAPAVKSPIADLAHIPVEAKFGGGGSITAALFLREFAGEARSWAHLDIAGPARADADEHEIGKGPTGFGARLLLDWLCS